MPVKEPSFIIKDSGLILATGRLYHFVNAKINKSSSSSSSYYVTNGKDVDFYVFVIKPSFHDPNYCLEYNAVIVKNKIIEKLFISPHISLEFCIEEIQ